MSESLDEKTKEVSPETSAPTACDGRGVGGGAKADQELIEALRRGDEAAFAALVQRYQTALVHLATTFVRDRALAEEAAQDTWLGVLRGIDRFEGRSSLKTWIFSILINRAKTQGQRTSRSVPFSSLDVFDAGPDEPAVDPSRFHPANHRWPGHWVSVPLDWGDNPEDVLVSKETGQRVMNSIELLPAGQRAVITLRDVEGWTSGEVCEVLDISETNQRVLLHRARSRVRRELERFVAESRDSQDRG
ncbi:MAG TPA: sigma-70 family RNA polymerase sigma factor [Thermomicrobiaceae bacterium]|nr:sigma-70 family RNA polymerase sigma factor [Thermomicrobiaceae bacterium]